MRTSLAMALLVAACAPTAERYTRDDFDANPAPVSAERRGGYESCHYRCKKCPPNKFCIEMCETVGHCSDSCDVIGVCVEGWVWDAAACACVEATCERDYVATDPTTCAASTWICPEGGSMFYDETGCGCEACP